LNNNRGVDSEHIMKSISTIPNFQSSDFLRQHIDITLRFYESHAFDPAGGFFHYFLDDGTVYNRTHRHLVSATRFVFNWCMAHVHTQRPPYRDWAAHGLTHLDRFIIPNGAQKGLSAWTLQDQGIEDATVMAYGQAFVLLAKAHAMRLGLTSSQDVARAFDVMGDAFYQAKDNAYADEITPEGLLIDYRGQNANMHMCEACLTAYAFTHEKRYLQRAQTLIERFAFELANQSDGLVWEHYRQDWSIDWDYNKDHPGNIFKPWGFQTGHQTEWAKLLLIAHQFVPDPRYVERAMALHQRAFTYGWDHTHGGLIYGFAPANAQGQYLSCDSDKYFWVQAESFASAWRLYQATGDRDFLQNYLDLWHWSWQYLVDHHYGAWFRIVSAEGKKLENTKSPAGKTDYHTMGACWDVLESIHPISPSTY
jgi:mannose/cellobiose epimerase-like protein (N-acyl-D-glucosamine 2-epimerase family)